MITIGTILKDIGDYKETLITLFTQAPEIRRLLINDNTAGDALPDQLPRLSILPYLHVEEAADTPYSCLCVETDISRVTSPAVKEMRITLWACCHKELLAYTAEGYQGTRTDILADMADRRLRSADHLGLRALKLESAVNFSPFPQFYGRQLIYTVPERKQKG